MSRHMIRKGLVFIPIQIFLQNILDRSVIVITDLMRSFAGLDESGISDPFTEREYSLTAFIGLFRVGFSGKDLANVVLHYWINSFGLFQKEGRIPLRYITVLGWHMLRNGRVIVRTPYASMYC